MDDQLSGLREQDRTLFSGSLTLRALRDSRYHNTAYAIAELIDNSIDANASQIELLCLEKYEQVNVRSSRQADAIAVLDNGEGMDYDTLFDALRFGEGTHHESPRGIGKYGMGLPTSSMSQCKRVDVWSWQDGVESAWHSYIDAEEIADGNYFVPRPDQESMDALWMQAADSKLIGNRTGTLVVWRDLDKVQWRAETIIEHTAQQIGSVT